MAACFTCDVCKYPIASEDSNTCYLNLSALDLNKEKRRDQRLGLRLDLCPTCAKGLFYSINAIANPVLS